MALSLKLDKHLDRVHKCPRTRVLYRFPHRSQIRWPQDQNVSRQPTLIQSEESSIISSLPPPTNHISYPHPPTHQSAFHPHLLAPLLSFFSSPYLRHRGPGTPLPPEGSQQQSQEDENYRRPSSFWLIDTVYLFSTIRIPFNLERSK